MRVQDLRPMQKAQLDTGATPQDLVGSEVQFVRDDLISTMGVAKKLELRDEHRRLAQILTAVDDLLAILADRGTR